MYLRWIILLTLVVCVVTVEVSVLTAWPTPFSLLPLSFLFGILLMQFVGSGYGTLWLVLSGILLEFVGLPDGPHALSYALAALAGWFLTQRVFTNRSVYAMMGLGTTTYFVVTLVEGFWFTFHGFFNSFAKGVLLQWIIFLAALFVSFFASRRLASLLRTIFLIRGT